MNMKFNLLLETHNERCYAFSDEKANIIVELLNMGYAINIPRDLFRSSPTIWKLHRIRINGMYELEFIYNEFGMLDRVLIVDYNYSTLKRLIQFSSYSDIIIFGDNSNSSIEHYKYNACLKLFSNVSNEKLSLETPVTKFNSCSLLDIREQRYNSVTTALTYLQKICEIAKTALK